MRIIHLSDLHIPEYGHDIWGINPVDHLKKVISKIKDLKNIDAIFISGDISNDGSLWSYQYFDTIFAELGIPTYCCPGNHDNLNLFYNEYQPHFYINKEFISFEKWSFIFMNSAVEGMSRGLIDEKKLENLLAQTNGNIAIILHHPPVEQEGWLNRKLLENRNKFNDIISKNKNVKLVLYGHTHYNKINKVNNIIYSSASSVGFAFNPELPKFEIAHGKEGYSVISLNDDIISIDNIII